MALIPFIPWCWKEIYIYIYTNKDIYIYIHIHNCTYICIYILLFSHSVMSNSIWPHGQQHSSCPSLSPRVCFSVLHYLLEFAQTHVHWVDDASWPSHPLSSPSPPAFNLSQHQGLFQWVSSSFTSGGQSIGASASASVLPINIQGWFLLGWTGLISLQSKGFSRVFSSTIVQKHQFSLLYGPTLTSVHDYWKNHSFS